MTFAWEIFNILFVDLDYNAYIYRSFSQYEFVSSLQ